MVRILSFFIIFFSMNIYANIGSIDSGYAPNNIPFFDLDGKKHHLDECDSQVCLVVFWASWHGSHEKQLEQLDNLKKDFKKLPFEIIMVSEDFEGPDYIKDLFKKYEIKNISPYHDMNNKLFNAFGMNSLPLAFLINDSGERVLKFSGEFDWCLDGVRNQILSFIPGSYPIPRNSCYKDSMNIKIKNDKEKVK